MVEGAQGAESDGRPVRSGLRSRVLWVHVACLVVGLICWLASLPQVDPAKINGWGLLPTLAAPWWIALLLASVPHLMAALDPAVPRWVLVAYRALLILVLLGTTAAVYDVPRYPWTYKHLGVVEYLLVNHTVDRTIDIYHNWPGFFALAAGLSALTNISPLDMARWAEPIFCFATVSALVFAARALVSNRRVLAVAPLVFILGSWTGANYFSPQAFAMVLALVFLGIFLRVIPVRLDTGEFVLRSSPARLLRDRRQLPVLSAGEGFTHLPPRAGWLAATVVWISLVVSHQLTPYALLAVMAALFVLVKFRHIWLLAVWAAIALGWTALALPFLTSQRLALVQSDPTSGLAPPTTLIKPVLPGMDQTGAASGVLIVVLPVAVAALVAWRLLRRREAFLIPGVLAFGPALVLLVQNYGGEALYRVYLYGLPWYSLLIAIVVVEAWDRRRLWRASLVGGVLALSALSLTAGLGQEIDYYVAPGDVRASEWFERIAEPDSFIITLTGLGFPLHMTEDYATASSYPPSLDSIYGGERPLAEGNDRIFDLFPQLKDRLKAPGYLALTNAQQTYARAYGRIDPAQWSSLVSELRSRPDFRIVYERDGVLIARYLG